MSCSKTALSSTIEPQKRNVEIDSDDEVVVLETPVKIIETISLTDSEDENNKCSDQGSIASSKSPAAHSQATAVSTSADCTKEENPLIICSQTESSSTDCSKEEKEMYKTSVQNLFNNPYVNPLLGRLLRHYYIFK